MNDRDDPLRSVWFAPIGIHLRAEHDAGRASRSWNEILATLARCRGCEHFARDRCREHGPPCEHQQRLIECLLHHGCPTASSGS